MIISEAIAPVADLLKRTALGRRTLSFKSFHATFQPGAQDPDKYDTLEEAARGLCPTSVAIYTALLAKATTGCPGNGFYSTFRIHRSSEYKQHAGDTSELDLSLEQQQTLVSLERRRVYQHAAAHF